MNVCLVRPPRCLDIKTVIASNTPALGLAFIAAALKQAGHTVSVIDALGESPKEYNPTDLKLNVTVPLPVDRIYTNGLSAQEIADRIPRSVDVIGVSAMFTNNWLYDRYLIDFLGDEFPSAVIIAGGESVTAMAEIAIKQTRHLDICVLGEGEETIVDLIDAIHTKGNFALVDGIAYREPGTKNTLFTKRRTRKKNLDEIPMPAWELLPVENYHKYEIKWAVTPQKTLPLVATRGCPYSCTFCSSPQMWGTRYYMRAPESVADEMQYLEATYGVTNFDFFDLTAIIKKEWIISFSQEIVKRKMNITWQLPAGTRSEVIDAEVAHHLYLSGCRIVVYAPETGSNKMLKLIKKNVKVPNMLKSMSYSHKENMYMYINMISGMPDETHSDIWQTWWFLIKCSWEGVNDINLSIFQPYPGSVLFDRLVKEKKIDLANDDFFLELLFLDSYGKAKYYNDSLSAKWYEFYDTITFIVFFSSNYLFRPMRFFRTINNVLQRRFENRIERNLDSFFKQKWGKLTVKTKAAKPKATTAA